MRKLLLESLLYGALFYIVAILARFPLRAELYMTPLRLAIVFAVLHFFYGWVRMRTRKERRKHKF